jgi:hypothetical protein
MKGQDALNLATHVFFAQRFGRDAEADWHDLQSDDSHLSIVASCSEFV